MEWFRIDARSGEEKVVATSAWPFVSMPFHECRQQGRRERMEMLFEIHGPCFAISLIKVEFQRLKPILIVD